MQPVLGVLLALAAALGSGRAPGWAAVGLGAVGLRGALQGLERPGGQARRLPAVALPRGRGGEQELEGCSPCPVGQGPPALWDLDPLLCGMGSLCSMGWGSHAPWGPGVPAVPPRAC